MRLDQTCKLMVGTKDAAHLPYIVAQEKHKKNTWEPLKPGTYVKFVDDKFLYYEACDPKDAQGIINPFITDTMFHEPVIIFLMPGITTPVRHNFEIRPELKVLEQKMLLEELEQIRKEDSDCGGCWDIHNNEIIRW